MCEKNRKLADKITLLLAELEKKQNIIDHYTLLYPNAPIPDKMGRMSPQVLNLQESHNPKDSDTSIDSIGLVGVVDTKARNKKKLAQTQFGFGKFSDGDDADVRLYLCI